MRTCVDLLNLGGVAVLRCCTRQAEALVSGAGAGVQSAPTIRRHTSVGRDDPDGPDAHRWSCCSLLAVPCPVKYET
jgi:hypothetical protein